MRYSSLPINPAVIDPLGPVVGNLDAVVQTQRVAVKQAAARGCVIRQAEVPVWDGLSVLEAGPDQFFDIIINPQIT